VDLGVGTCCLSRIGQADKIARSRPTFFGVSAVGSRLIQALITKKVALNFKFRLRVQIQSLQMLPRVQTRCKQGGIISCTYLILVADSSCVAVDAHVTGNHVGNHVSAQLEIHVKYHGRAQRTPCYSREKEQTTCKIRPHLEKTYVAKTEPASVHLIPTFR
jgi:hypothetical protein